MMIKKMFTLITLTLAVSMLFSVITIISPNGNETWTPGYLQNITWSWSVNETGNLKIELFRSYTLAATISSSTAINDGHCYWTPPVTLTPAGTYFIRITSLTNSNVWDVSDAYFSVGPAPTLSVTSPNGGENWNKGGTYPITWNSTNLTGNVSIVLLIDTYGNQLTVQNSVAASAGSYNWTVPNTVQNGNIFKIRLASSIVPAIRDTSDNFFTLTQPINVTSPGEDVEWITGSTYVITWTATNITGSALIELYQGTNTTPISTIISSTVMTYGNRVWTIPTTIPPADNYRIKISSLATPGIYDYSYYFTISNPSSTDDPNTTPLITELQGNYPNPFRIETEIKYSVKEAGNISLEIFDVKGRRVRQLHKTKSGPGTFSTSWDGTDSSGKKLGNGMYYLHLKTDYHQASRKMVLLK